MARKKQPRDGGNLMGIARSIMLNTITAMVVMVALTALFAFIMSLVTIPSVVLTGIVMLLLIFVGFASGYLSAKSVRRDGLKVGLTCGVLISLLLFVLSGVLYDSFGWQCVTKMLVVTAASSIGGVLGVNSRKKYR